MTEPPDKLLIALLIAVIIISGIVLLRVENPPEVPLNAYSGLTVIDGAYLRANLPPALVIPTVYGSIIGCLSWHESRDNPDAIGKAGERGCLQFMPSSWEYFTEKYNMTYLDIDNTEDQITLADKMLKENWNNIKSWTTYKRCVK